MKLRELVAILFRLIEAVQNDGEQISKPMFTRPCCHTDDSHTR